MKVEGSGRALRRAWLSTFTLQLSSYFVPRFFRAASSSAPPGWTWEESERRAISTAVSGARPFVALVAGVLGFGGIAGAAMGIAKVLFFIAIAIFVILLIAGLAVGKRVKDAL